MSMSKAEKKRLMDKLGAVLATGDITEEQAAAQMTEIIRKSYANGLQSGIPVATVSPWATDASIRKAADSMSSRVGSIWNSLGNELSTTITSGIKAGKSYEEVSSSVDELIRNGWGDHVEFDNRGHVIRRVRVSPDGKMEWEDHTITHKKTMTTEAYATNLSQTVVHESWNKARDDQYDDLGIEEWDYSAVGDAVTRLEHLAMHGKRIRRGSADEVMAESLMSEPNCRCKKIAVWGDPELDTDPEVWERQKIAAAKRERENVADGTPEAAYLDEIISGEKPDSLPDAAAASNPFESAQTHDDLKQAIYDNWNSSIKITNNFQNLDFDAMKANLAKINDVYKDFAGASKHLTTIKSKSEKNAFAFCSHKVTDELTYNVLDGMSELSFCNKSFAADQKAELLERYARSYKRKFLAAPTIDYIGTHEIGHSIEVILAYNARTSLDAHAANIVKTAARNILKKEPSYIELSQLRREISGYAQTSPAETVAEAFADVYANTDTAKSLSKEVVKLIKDEWHILFD